MVKFSPALYSNSQTLSEAFSTVTMAPPSLQTRSHSFQRRLRSQNTPSISHTPAYQHWDDEIDDEIDNDDLPTSSATPRNRRQLSAGFVH